MSDPIDPVAAGRYGRKFEDIDHELAKYATVCRLNLLDQATVERVLRNDPGLVADAQRPAFDKMRALLYMHYAVRTQAAEALGQAPTQALIDGVVARLRERLGQR